MSTSPWKRCFIVAVSSALVAAAAFVRVPTAQAGDAQCGEKGQPACPLQDWMEKNVQAAIDAEDLAKVAALLEKVATLAPDPKWNDGDKGWSKIAKEGAAKAKAGDMKATAATCKSCHTAWRKQYKAEHRTKPLPKGL